MKTVVLMDVVPGTGTNAEGLALFSILHNYIGKGEKVNLSFHDATPLSSSFFNSSFGELIATYGKSKFKEYITIVEISKSQGEIFKKYISMIEQYAS